MNYESCPRFYHLLPRLLLRPSSDGSESLALEDDFESLRLREVGTLLFLSRSLEREEPELELLDESESEDEDESDSEPEPESESESESEELLQARLSNLLAHV